MCQVVQFRDQPVIVRQQVVLQLHVERIARRRRRPDARHRARTFPVTRQQAPGASRRAGSRTMRCRPSVLARDEVVGEARHALGAREVRGAGQPAQAAIAGHVARQQDEVRTQLTRSDTAQILASRLTRWPGGRRRSMVGRTARPSAGGSDGTWSSASSRAFRRRRGGTTSPAGPAPRRRAARSPCRRWQQAGLTAAVANRTAPYRPW